MNSFDSFNASATITSSKLQEETSHFKVSASSVHLLASPWTRGTRFFVPVWRLRFVFLPLCALLIWKELGPLTVERWMGNSTQAIIQQLSSHIRWPPVNERYDLKSPHQVSSCATRLRRFH